ncbi:hypothetical protein V6Z12_D04G109200 [Gossypium hirsutum]
MMPTSGSSFLGESQFISKPPYFSGANYSYQKTRMILFIQEIDLVIWDIIMDGPSILLKQEGELLDRRSIKLNTKAIRTLFCVLGPNEYSRVSSCTNIKDLGKVRGHS